LPVAGGEPKQIPVEAETIEEILWSPQGGQLAVLGKTAQPKPPQEAETWLWLVDVDSGKNTRLVRVHRSNHYLAHQGARLCWSPDGTRLAYLATDAEAAPHAEGPIVVDRIQYKTRTGLSDNRRTHIWTVETAT